MTVNALGIYEKALPQDLTWAEKFKLTHELGFNFLEFSVDESDARLARLDWTRKQRKDFRDAMWETGSRINTMMLSGHRKFPLGSKDPKIRERSLEMMRKAIDLAVDLGIRNIQLAGYDVFYEEKTNDSRELFVENLRKCVNMASQKLVMLSIETMDDPFINSIGKVHQYQKQIRSPWLQAYPDLGNLSAWPENNVPEEFENYLQDIAAIHLKDTEAVTPTSKGKFKDVAFGEGCVDFTGLLRLLARLQYSGSYTIEMWSGDNHVPDPIADVKEAKQFFDQIFKEVGIQQEPLI